MTEDVETGTTTDAEKKIKKKFYKNVTISNPSEINGQDLVSSMRDRFRKKAKTWEAKASAFSRCSFSLTFLILFLQVFHMVLLPMKKVIIPEQYYTLVTTLVSAASALIAGLQLKLKMNEKAEKLREGVRMYNKLLRSSAYFTMMTENGGKFEDDDTIVFWKQALRTEVDDIPIIRTMGSV